MCGIWEMKNAIKELKIENKFKVYGRNVSYSMSSICPHSRTATREELG